MLRKETNMEILKVSSNTRVNSLAGAIAGTVREEGIVEISAIGAGAVNQAIKAIATAKGFLSPGGINIVCTPSFGATGIGTDERTFITITVKKETH